MVKYGCAGQSILRGALGVCPAANGHCRGSGAGSLPGTPKNDGYRWVGRLQLRGVGQGGARRECLLAVSNSVPRQVLWGSSVATAPNQGIQ